MSNQSINYHQPVLLEESVEALKPRDGGIYVDTTFGGGGHTEQLLQQFQGGHLIAFDQDADSLSNAPNDERLTLIQQNFRFLKRYLRFFKHIPVDGIMADLGVSSYQIDTPEKGFSTRYEGDLDMRMNRQSPLTAAYVVAHYSLEELQQMFSQYGEVRNARQLAHAITEVRNHTPIETTGDLCRIAESVAKGNRNKYLAQVFQALRIEVNEELETLKALLEQSADVLKPHGRMAVITYHSLEDRLVKNFFRKGTFSGESNKDVYGHTWVPFQEVYKKPLTASDDEMAYNPRARSAKLRVAEKVVEDVKPDLTMELN
jgi:16S rRNA (cytosine1402-N4)-methyltransferase